MFLHQEQPISKNDWLVRFNPQTITQLIKTVNSVFFLIFQSGLIWKLGGYLQQQ